MTIAFAHSESLVSTRKKEEMIKILSRQPTCRGGAMSRFDEVFEACQREQAAIYEKLGVNLGLPLRGLPDSGTHPNKLDSSKSLRRRSAPPRVPADLIYDPKQFRRDRGQS